MDEFAWQLMVDDFFSHASDLDQFVQIDAGVDAHFLTQQHEFFGADVARGLGLAGEGATTEAADS